MQLIAEMFVLFRNMPLEPVRDIANKTIDIGIRMLHGIEPLADAAQHEAMLVAMPAKIEPRLSGQTLLSGAMVNQGLENRFGLFGNEGIVVDARSLERLKLLEKTGMLIVDFRHIDHQRIRQITQ